MRRQGNNMLNIYFTITMGKRADTCCDCQAAVYKQKALISSLIIRDR